MLTKKQLELRREGVGASEIAALAKMSAYATPIQIYESKVLGRSIESTYAMELGNEMEAPIARVWARMNERFIANVDTLKHPTKPFALATPDRAVYLTAAARGDARMKKSDVRDAEKLLQVKSTNWRMRHLWGDEFTDNIPNEYLLQAHWEGAVAGLREVFFAVDFDKTRVAEYRVTVDLALFDALYEIAARFMTDHVLAKRPPDPDASDSYAEFLQRQFPRHAKEELDTVEDAETIIEDIAQFARIKAAEDRIETIKKLLRNRIVQRISSAAGITGSFGKITYKATKDRQVLDEKKVISELQRTAGLAIMALPEGDLREQLKKELSEVVTKNTTTKPGYRVLRPTWAGPLKLEAEVIELRLEALQQGLEERAEEEQVPASQQQ